MSIKDTYLTLSEVAKVIGVTRQTISRWIKEGKLSGEKIGRETLIEKKSLEKYHMRQIAETSTFIDAMIAGFTEHIRTKGNYSKNDQIEYIGELEFRVTKKDGTQEKVEIQSVEIIPEEMKISPYKKSNNKQGK